MLYTLNLIQQALRAIKIFEKKIGFYFPWLIKYFVVLENKHTQPNSIVIIIALIHN